MLSPPDHEELQRHLHEAVFTQTVAGAATASSDQLPVINPATGEAFQQAPKATRADLDAAVTAARAAQPAWADMGWEARAACLERLADAIEGAIDRLAYLNTLEQGGPLKASYGQLAVAVSRLRVLGAVRAPDKILQDDGERLVIERWVPLGVVAAIAPWNAPISLGVTKVVNALIGGNTIVLKPSELTPLATLEIGRLGRDVLPPGVFNVLCGGGDLGAAMSTHEGFDKVSFTGSTTTGRAIAAQSAGAFRPTTLELGGNDAAILLPDGAQDELIAAAVRTGLANCGQFCAGIKRIYVPTALHDAFAARLAQAAQAIRQGSGLEPEVEMGPIQNRAQFDKVCAIVDDARASGGQVLTGGRPAGGAGYFYPPTVVTGLKDGARLVDEEQFGPVLPIVAYDDLDSVIATVNNGPYGLTGSIWTADEAEGLRLASRLTVGTGWVNTHGAFDGAVAMPLIKHSGVGIDNAEYGVKGAMRLQVLVARRPSR